MALIDDRMLCKLCNKPLILESSPQLFVTTFIAIQDERFALLNDTAVHQECIDTWTLRDEFIAHINSNHLGSLAVVKGHVVYKRRAPCAAKLFSSLLRRWK